MFVHLSDYEGDPNRDDNTAKFGMLIEMIRRVYALSSGKVIDFLSYCIVFFLF